MKPPLILILCTGNSCRSQMAEAFLEKSAGGLFSVASAGSDPAGFVHPIAIEVMSERGIDIAANESKHLDEFLDRDVETVITVCGNADQACPAFPGQANRHHWPFDDPAKAEGTREDILASFRETRDRIEAVFTAYGQGRIDQHLHATTPSLPHSDD